MTSEASPNQPAELNNALKFLILEVSKQLLLLEQAVRSGEKALLTASFQTTDYVNNHAIGLQNRCLELLTGDAANVSPLTPTLIQSHQQIGFHLQAFSIALAQIAQEMLALPKLKPLQKKGVVEALDLLKIGLNLIEPALQTHDSKMATNICRLKLRIAYLTEHSHKKLTHKLKKQAKKCSPRKAKQQGNQLLNAFRLLLIIDHLEEASSVLLRIGEQILSAQLGQPLRFEQMQSLAELLDQVDQALDNDRQDEKKSDTPLPIVRPLAETKSGCTISGVMLPQSPSDTPKISAIFKEGCRKKLEEEKAGIEAWHKKFPGIAPQLLSYHKKGGKAALLFEYLTGETLEYFIQHRKTKQLKLGLQTLFTLLQEIWQETQIDEPRPMQAMRQLRRRLKSVYHVHPSFQQVHIEQDASLSLEPLIKRAEKLENRLKQPNAVYIHGDFNVDNLLYDPMENKISFIDLHRSRYADYVQDLSTLIVSAYRIMNFHPKVRLLIGELMQQTYQFGADYAAQTNDTTYAVRMALGLARNYITSTRFVLDEAHAKEMLHRGQSLLHQVIQLDKTQRKHYQIPPQLLEG